MNVRFDNSLFLKNNLNISDYFPKLLELQKSPLFFPFSFGLDELPEEPGLVVVRGARQYGKSSWLESQLSRTYQSFGPGSCFYINGDEVKDVKELQSEIAKLCESFPKDQNIRRIFIDEISSISNWTKAIKILWDRGISQRTLIITTGSDAEDLRSNSELLPGRKGMLSRTQYLFTPISFLDFENIAKKYLSPAEIFHAYIMSGGSPIACRELCLQKRIPEYVISAVREWIFGAFAAKGRSRATLLAINSLIFKYAQNPISSAKLARESGSANNTVIEGYLEQLKNLLCIAKALPWDANTKLTQARKPGKIHFTNTLCAVALGVEAPHNLPGFMSLTPATKSKWLEWIVAQEIWRRAAVAGSDIPEALAFWQSSEHEIDFVVNNSEFIEVKSGPVSPWDFSWFSKSFPKKQLLVLNEELFENDFVRGQTIANFLRGSASFV